MIGVALMAEITHRGAHFFRQLPSKTWINEMALPRKPDALKLTDGTADRDGDLADVVLPPGVPSKPDSLSKHAGELWDAIVPGLIECGAVAAIDGTMLAAMAEWHARYRQWAGPLDAGEPDDDGSRRRLMGACAAWKQFEGLASKFGLSPGDRARLRVQPVKKAPGLPKRPINSGASRHA